MKEFVSRLAIQRVGIVGACLMLACTALIPTERVMATAEPGNPYQILTPAPSGKKNRMYHLDEVTIDYGNSSQGYVMVKHKRTRLGLKVRISFGKMVCTYDLNKRGEYEVFPLQMGDGRYKVEVFRKAEKGSILVASKTVNAKLVTPNIAFLYPNQYINYKGDSKAVAKSYELCNGYRTDREKATAIYAYCSREISYQYTQAFNVKRGYLPDIDRVLEEKVGICFDYAALMACMLRAQGIATQLVIGNADGVYHAWNNVLLDGKWYRYDAASVSTSNKVRNYVEERHY